MFVHNIPVLQLWERLHKTFEDRSPDAAGKIMWKMAQKSLADFQGITEYIDSFPSALARISSIFNGRAATDPRETAEAFLQSYFIQGLGKDYQPFSLDVRKNWKWENTNLKEVMTLASRYRTEEPTPKQALLTHKRPLGSSTPQAQKRQRAPAGSCTNQSCIDRNSTFHWPEKCWVTHPELRKYPLRPDREKSKDNDKDKENRVEPKYQS